MTFDEIVINHVECVNDVHDALENFYALDYTIVELKGDGLIAYTEHEDHYFIWFAYNDGLLSNTKTLYNVAKELAKSKAVLYSGVKDYFSNKSEELGDKLYKLK